MSTVTTIGVADPRPFPDVILRSQFFEMVGTRSLSSEQRLMLAVLADAINVVQEFGGSTSLRKRNSFQRGLELVLHQGRLMSAVVRERMRRARHRRRRPAMASVGTGRRPRRHSASLAAEGSEPDAAPHRQSSAAPRSAPDASRQPRPALGLRFNLPTEPRADQRIRARLGVDGINSVLLLPLQTHGGFH